ncbi:hypothetical protein PT7_2147 [Pusillimonas sp. T7-7]|nr:hypothetical protein PT7_2147 [Pusillimonas sp. T7-7]
MVFITPYVESTRLHGQAPGQDYFLYRLTIYFSIICDQTDRNWPFPYTKYC